MDLDHVLISSSIFKCITSGNQPRTKAHSFVARGGHLAHGSCAGNGTPDLEQGISTKEKQLSLRKHSNLPVNYLKIKMRARTTRHYFFLQGTKQDETMEEQVVALPPTEAFPGARFCRSSWTDLSSLSSPSAGFKLR